MNRNQGIALTVAAANLLVILLFPPFESVFALTNAMLPSFEGFYFIFMRPQHHVIIATLLYLEVAFILVNGALLWMIFRPRRSAQFAPGQAYALLQRLRKK